MTWDWKRLGEQLQAARKAQGLRQTDLAERAGVSLATVQAVESGKEYAKITPTVRSIARTVGWTDGSPKAVLEGGQPTLTEAPGRAGDTQPDALTLPLRIQDELRDGQILDSGVYDLTPEGSDAQLIIVVKGKEGASYDEVRRWLDRWRETERKLRQLGDEDPES